MNNSTVSLVHLWHLCAESQGGDADGVLHWTTLRRALDGLPITRCEALNCASIDDILRRHFGWDHRGSEHVNFARYWRGMEAMLQTCGAFHSGGLDDQIQRKVSSLRAFRDLLLDELPGTAFGYAASKAHSVMDIRRLFDRLRAAAARGGAGPVAAYWDCRLQQLPPDDETVTGDEVASAIIMWLEELLEDSSAPGALGAGVVGEQAPAFVGDDGSSSSSASSASEEPEHERTPMGTMPAAGPRDAACAWRTSSPGGRPEPRGPSRGPQLPPPPRRHVGEGGPGGDPARRSAQGVVAGAGGACSSTGTPRWLQPGAGGAFEPPEAERFRERLVAALAGERPGVFQFFRAVREAAEDTAPGLRSGCLAAAVRCLAGVAHRQLRSAFRELEVWSRRAGGRRPLPRLGGNYDIIAGLLCSQARAAEVLERRIAQVDPAWRVACSLSRARRQVLCEAMDRWRA